MEKDYGSLLALDAFASEQSIRVAVYARAMDLRRTISRPPPVEEIADNFLAFVKGDRWRLEALDVALRQRDHRSTVASMIESAGRVVAWARPAIEPTARAGKPATVKKSTSKKTGRKKN